MSIIYRRSFLALLLTAVTCICVTALAEDWPTWGHSTSRNMYSPTAKNLPASFDPGKYKPGTEQIDMSTTKNIKWVTKLGSSAYGNTSVANGHVYVGTNNELPDKDARFEGDFSVLLCLDEKTGQPVWKLTVPKLGAGKVGDWEFLGICSSAAIEGDRVYIVTNRCEVLCLDANGMANGNDGPFKDEGQYFIGPEHPPVQVKATDADIIWRYDMRDELGIFPHNITSSSPLIVGDKIFVATSNGVDWTHTSIPSPTAPSLIALDKNTGKLVGEEAAGISTRILHGGWSSPTAGQVNGKTLVFFGGPDGILYAFDPVAKKDADGFDILPVVFKFDCDPVNYRFKDGDKTKPIKYQRPDGPSEIIATPVFYKDRVYLNIGQDPEHGEGIGNIVSLDATKTGDLGISGAESPAELWHSTAINRSLATHAIADGLLYTADFSGYIYCFDVETGKLYWKHDTLSHIWGSPLVADGKLYLGNEDGTVVVINVDEMKKLADEKGAPISTGLRRGVVTLTDASGKKAPLDTGRSAQLMTEAMMPGPVYSTAIAANDVVYIATATHLFAISSTK